MALKYVVRSIRTELSKVYGTQYAQSLHTGCPVLVAEKALLVKLRKSTGYTFINCKKALVKFDNDITQAESWLHEQAQKEGWTKATKLEGRRANQGVVGVFIGNRAAVMVEVNCETDFVARNEKFQQLVKEAAFAAMAHHRRRSQAQTGYSKSLLATEELSNLPVGEGASPSLADQLALTIGRLGENMSVRRAVTVAVPADWHIGSYVHGGVASPSDVAMGRYGALVVFQGGADGTQGTLGRKLGQHIVGEAPVALGNANDLPCGEAETRLLPQSFLSDPSQTVAQYLAAQGARVLDFVRFQCGEAEVGSGGAAE